MFLSEYYNVMTPGYIEELDDEERVMKEEYKEMGGMCEPYGEL